MINDSGMLELYRKLDDKPWKGLAECPDSPMKPTEAQKKYLNWEVHKLPAAALVSTDPPRFQLVEKPADGKGVFKPKFFFTARHDSANNAYYPFAPVGPDYKIVQNHDMAELMELLANEGGLMVHTVGWFFGGAKVWMLARYNGTARHIVKDDMVDRNVLIANGHDGNLALTVAATMVRISCWNSFVAAIRGAKRKRHAVSIRHSGDPQRKLEEIRKVLGVLGTTFDQQEVKFKELAALKMSDKNVLDGLAVMFPDPKAPTNPARMRNMRNTMFEIYSESSTIKGMPGVHGTGWGWLNMFTQALDHGLLRNVNADSRMNATFLGTYQEIKDKAVEMAFAITGKGVEA